MCAGVSVTKEVNNYIGYYIRIMIRKIFFALFFDSSDVFFCKRRFMKKSSNSILLSVNSDSSRYEIIIVLNYLVDETVRRTMHCIAFLTNNFLLCVGSSASCYLPVLHFVVASSPTHLNSPMIYRDSPTGSFIRPLFA
jgi:hypothetical protein